MNIKTKTIVFTVNEKSKEHFHKTIKSLATYYRYHEEIGKETGNAHYQGFAYSKKNRL